MLLLHLLLFKPFLVDFWLTFLKAQWLKFWTSKKPADETTNLLVQYKVKRRPGYTVSKIWAWTKRWLEGLLPSNRENEQRKQKITSPVSSQIKRCESFKFLREPVSQKIKWNMDLPGSTQTSSLVAFPEFKLVSPKKCQQQDNSKVLTISQASQQH